MGQQSARARGEGACLTKRSLTDGPNALFQTDGRSRWWVPALFRRENAQRRARRRGDEAYLQQRTGFRAFHGFIPSRFPLSTACMLPEARELPSNRPNELCPVWGSFRAVSQPLVRELRCFFSPLAFCLISTSQPPVGCGWFQGRACAALAAVAICLPAFSRGRLGIRILEGWGGFLGRLRGMPAYFPCSQGGCPNFFWVWR